MSAGKLASTQHMVTLREILQMAILPIEAIIWPVTETLMDQALLMVP